MKTVQEKIDESFSQKTKDNPENVDTSTITHKEAKAKTKPKAAHGSNNPFDKENDDEDDNLSSRKIVHDLQLSLLLEKRVMNGM